MSYEEEHTAAVAEAKWRRDITAKLTHAERMALRFQLNQLIDPLWRRRLSVDDALVELRRAIASRKGT
jgi:hypothetical protein